MTRQEAWLYMNKDIMGKIMDLKHLTKEILQNADTNFLFTIIKSNDKLALRATLIAEDPQDALTTLVEQDRLTNKHYQELHKHVARKAEELQYLAGMAQVAIRHPNMSWINDGMWRCRIPIKEFIQKHNLPYKNAYWPLPSEKTYKALKELADKATKYAEALKS